MRSTQLRLITSMTPPEICDWQIIRQLVSQAVRDHAPLHQIGTFKSEVDAGKVLFDSIAAPLLVARTGNGNVCQDRGLAAARWPEPTRYLAAGHNIFDIPIFALCFFEIAVERKRQRLKFAARSAAFLL